MLVLALDTTTRAGSAALADERQLIGMAAIDPSQPIATRLPADLMALLERGRLELKQIDVFAVATGPGSFTGLRIGIATMQGLALAEGKPLVGVSGFDALARIANAPRVATWVDAWRGEIYAALYDGGAAVSAPVVAPPAQVLEQIGTSQPTLFIGDGAVSYRALIVSALDGQARIAEPPAPLLAPAVATLAIEAARAGQLTPPHAIRPLYVRRPDAELARNRRA